MPNEKKCMNALSSKDMSFISFAARPSIIAYHQHHLAVQKDGRCIIKEIPA
jgi:hypothetical protein